MLPSFSRTARITFTIDSAATQTPVGTPLDIGEGNTLVGILSPANIGSAASMTFDASAGTTTTLSNPNPTAPAASGDYADCKDQAGAELITITLSAGDWSIFDAATAAKAANLPRWLRPTLNAAPSSVSPVFVALVRVY